MSFLCVHQEKFHFFPLISSSSPSLLSICETLDTIQPLIFTNTVIVRFYITPSRMIPSSEHQALNKSPSWKAPSIMLSEGRYQVVAEILSLIGGGGGLIIFRQWRQTKCHWGLEDNYQAWTTNFIKKYIWC